MVFRASAVTIRAENGASPNGSLLRLIAGNTRPYMRCTGRVGEADLDGVGMSVMDTGIALLC